MKRILVPCFLLLVHIVQGANYRNDGLLEHGIDIYLPDQLTTETQGILMVHGGGWTAGQKENMRDQCSDLRDLGYLTATMNYTLHPNWVSKSNAIGDVRDAYLWLSAQYPSTKIHVLGSSAGGHLAAASVHCLGLRPESLILLYPPVDLARLPSNYHYIWTPEQLIWSPYQNINSNCGLDTIIYIGTNDNLIPMNIVQDYRSLSVARGNYCVIKDRPGRAHGFLNDKTKPDYFWFLTHLNGEWLNRYE